MIKLLLLCILSIVHVISYGEDVVKLVSIKVPLEQVDMERWKLDWVENREKEMAERVLTLVRAEKAKVIYEFEVLLRGTNAVMAFAESTDVFYVMKTPVGYELVKSVDKIGVGYEFNLKKIGLDDVLFIYKFEKHVEARELFEPMHELPIGKPQISKERGDFASLAINKQRDGAFYVVEAKGWEDSLEIMLIQIRQDKWN